VTLTPSISPLTPRQIQARLLQIATLFLFLFSLALTFAPAVRERAWLSGLRWGHWAGFALWCLVFWLAHRQMQTHLPDADPFLMPIAALLSGWGLLTIWRLDAAYGWRQTLWLGLCGAILILGLRLSPTLQFLRRYKYLWLSSGILLTMLTFLFGKHPLGEGPRLWLGCCGVYFQPSEPLKLLLVVYLAAYLSERLPLPSRPAILLAPTAILTGLALMLLLLQRDLGTASLFLLLYSAILWTATRRGYFLWLSLAGLLAAGSLGYLTIDVVRLRIDSWLNPWQDPSGHSFQIVQSLMAIANGGIFGRGPGLGNPGLVPVAISDFIFSAIAEESGFMGVLFLVVLLGLLLERGMRIALRAPDCFRRLLALGLTVYLGLQSLVIMGGNLRLLPLTGVTLPFLSYGGSSLLTAFLSLLLLLLISVQGEEEAAYLASARSYLSLTALLGAGLFAVALAGFWWGVWRGPDLLTRTDNARRAISDRYVRRGSLLDRENRPLAITQGAVGEYQRVYPYPDLAPVLGYTHPVYGQAGLEASLDGYLRGLQGNPASLIWWHHLLYGQPPPGLDVRLSLDLDLQKVADAQLRGHRGAAVLLNARSGEILVMASQPAYDPMVLETEAATLLSRPDAPLLNRAAQGRYPAGEVLTFFLRAAGLSAASPAGQEAFCRKAGFYTAPALRLPVAQAAVPGEELLVSPLQVALAAASLSQGGVRPAPRLALAVNTPQQGWVILPPLDEPAVVFSPAQVEVARDTWTKGTLFWEWSGRGYHQEQAVVWYLAGTPPDWSGMPLTLVLLLEEDQSLPVHQMGQAILTAALQP
jgi:cell division protein FtsW (lipid II flippase)